jgi:hypothetical protein
LEKVRLLQTRERTGQDLSKKMFCRKEDKTLVDGETPAGKNIELGDEKECNE